MYHLAEHQQPEQAGALPIYLNLPLVSDADVERALEQEQGA